MDPITVIVPASPYKKSILAYQSSISNCFKNSAPFQLSSLFDLAPLAPADAETKPKMVARGEFQIKGSNATNTGGPFTARFDGEPIGRVNISIPATMSLNKTNSAELKLSSSGDQIAVQLPDLSSRLGRDFIFESVSWGAESMSISLRRSGGKVKLVAKFTDTLLAEEDQACCCGEEEEWVINQTTTAQVCYVQKPEARPQFGRQIAGPFSSKSKANKKLKELKDSGVCK